MSSLVYIYTKKTIYTLRLNQILKKFSSFPRINPYCLKETDKRFDQYQAFAIRVLNDNSGIKGPATVVFPGIPVDIYGSSNAAFLAPAPRITRAFIGDSYTNLDATTNLNCDNYPLITIPALLSLYQKFQQKSNKENPVTISYNETAITDIDAVIPCITGLDNIDKSIETICAHEELVKEIDQIVFYKKDEGSFFKLVIEDERQPEAKFSSLIKSPNKIVDLFSSGKIRAQNKFEFAKNVLTKDNFDSDSELKKFSYDCYNQAVQEVALHIVKENNGEIFNDPFNSPLLEILTKDAQNLISIVGKEKIISAFEISNMIPETSVRNPSLVLSQKPPIKSI